jgi:hypothetical protein
LLKGFAMFAGKKPSPVAYGIFPQSTHLKDGENAFVYASFLEGYT